MMCFRPRKEHSCGYDVLSAPPHILLSVDLEPYVTWDPTTGKEAGNTHQFTAQGDLPRPPTWESASIASTPEAAVPGSAAT